MRKDSPQNFNCEFATETVDFIYGELNEARRSSFQAHLNNCSDCAAEVSDFSDIKFSIQSWKANEFDRLATPPLEIPYPRAEKGFVTVENQTSWFDSVRNHFRFSPVLSGAAAFVILAFIAGAAFFTLKNGNKDLLAESNVKSDISPTPVNSRQTVSETARQDQENDTAENEEKSLKAEKATDNIETEKNSVRRNDSIKTNAKISGGNKVQPVRTFDKKSAAVEPVNDKQKSVQLKKKPRLIALPEDEEDNSLRLSDMFADLDTRE